MSDRLMCKHGHNVAMHVNSDSMVSRFDVTNMLLDSMTCVDGIDVGNFVDELFGDELELPFSRLMEWAFAATITIR